MPFDGRTYTSFKRYISGVEHSDYNMHTLGHLKTLLDCILKLCLYITINVIRNIDSKTDRTTCGKYVQFVNKVMMPNTYMPPKDANTAMAKIFRLWTRPAWTKIQSGQHNIADGHPNARLTHPEAPARVLRRLAAWGATTPPAMIEEIEESIRISPHLFDRYLSHS